MRKTNLVLLSLAIAGLACAGFMIVDFIERSDSSNKPARGLLRGGVNRQIGQAPPVVRQLQPVFQGPITQPARGRPLAEAPAGKPNLRLGTLRFRHGGRISALAASSETKILASCGVDGKVRIWDAETGEAVIRLSGGGEPLQCVALSRDGRWVAAGAQRGMLYLWEVASGRSTWYRQVANWEMDRNGVQRVAFAPDGRTLASLGFDHEVCMWQVPSATRLWSWRADARGLFFSPDGKTLATFLKKDPPMSSMPGGSVLLLDPATGKERAGIFQPEDIGVGLAFSPDGMTLAIGGRDGIVRLWDMRTGEKLHSFEGHSRMVYHVAFAPDGKTLVSVSSDIRLWDLASGKERCRLQCRGPWVVSVAFSHDSKTLYSADDDHIIHRWDTDTGKKLESDEEQGPVTAVAITGDGKTVVLAEKDAILHAWDLTTGKQVRQYRGHQRPVQCVAYSGDGRLLASSADQHEDRRQSEVRLWDATTGQEVLRWDGTPYPVEQIRFLQGDKSLAAVEARRGRVHIWETSTGQELHQFDGNWMSYSSFSPDGALLAVWGPQSVQLWNVADRSRFGGEFRPEISTPPFGNLAQGYRGILISAQALSPGGQYLACAARHENGTIHVFKVATGKELDLPQGHVAAGPPWREPVSALAWSHDGKTLASGGGDGQIWLWDLSTAKALLRCPGHLGPVTALAFSSDDRTLVSGSDDTTALVWDLTGVRDASKKRQP